jgi:hypothetical protein
VLPQAAAPTSSAAPAPAPQVAYTLSFSGEQVARALQARDGLIAAASRAMVAAGAMQAQYEVQIDVPPPQSKKDR